MEQRCEKNFEKINNIDKRVSILEDNDKIQDDRIREHGKQIDTILLANAKQDANQELMKKDLESIKRTSEKTEDKLDKIMQKPLLTIDRVKNVFLGLFIGFLFTLLMKALFPHIGG